ncbi:hypothetical protein K7H13_13770 [Qipengyuania citrea]|uniref:hypothetical protein n=1 Tax=Qipengyuania citrea TaxID=225971 RepID=UPI001E34EF71|nr:hypothetical protein [Qipengyuania citrea]MCD1591817.1 hypothetical protein [Qipengyuania citrea]
MTALSSYRGQFKVSFEGQDITTGHGVVYSVMEEVGCDAEIDAATGVYLLYSVTNDSAYATFKAVHQGKEIVQRFTVAKSRAGVDGTPAKVLSVTSSTQTITYNKDGEPDPVSQTITFNAFKQNSTGTVVWSVTDINGEARMPVGDFLSAASGDQVTMTLPQFVAARNGTTGVIVTAALADGSGLADHISVVHMQDGATGPVGPSLALLPSQAGFTYLNGNLTPASQTITFTAMLDGVEAPVSWTTSPNVKSASGTSTFSISSSEMGGNSQLIVTATADGGVSHSFPLAKLADSSATVGMTPAERAESVQLAADVAAVEQAASEANTEAATARSEIAQARTDLSGDVQEARDELAAEVLRATNEEGAIRSIAETAQSDANGLTTRIANEETVRANADSALSSRASTLESKLDLGTDSPLYARIRNEETTRSNADSAIAGRTSVLETQASKSRKNYIDLSWWNDGAVIPWGQNGGAGNQIHRLPDPTTAPWANIRGPRGNSDAVWLARADAGGQQAGGWNGAPTLQLDPDQTYRFMVPIMHMGEEPRSSFWGVHGVCDLNTTTINGNPYFAHCDFSALTALKWYLFVGYIFPRNSTQKTHDGAGIYDTETGEIVRTGWNFCFHPDGRQISHRAYQFYAADGAYQSFGRPSIELVDGTEPPLLETFKAQRQTNARIATEETARANADSALAGRTSTLESRVGGHNSTDIVARLDSEELTRASADSALATRSTNLESRFNKAGTFEIMRPDTFIAAHSSPPETPGNDGEYRNDTPHYGPYVQFSTVTAAKREVHAIQRRNLFYRLRARVWQVSGPTTKMMFYAEYFDTNFNRVNSGVLGNIYTIPDGAFHTHTYEGEVPFHEGAVWVRFFLLVNRSIDNPHGAGVPGAVTRIFEFTTEDATSLRASELSFNAKIATEETTRANADGALANRATLLEARGSGGGNLLSNTTLETMTGWTPINGLGAAAGAAFVINLAGYDYHPENEHTLGLFQGTRLGTTGYLHYTSERFSVRPGSWIQWYVLANAHRAPVGGTLYYYDRNGSYLGFSDQYANVGANEGKSLASYTRIGVPSTKVPAGATTAALELRKFDSYEGSNDSYGWFIRPYVGEAREGQTEWNPFVHGSGRAARNETHSRLVTEESTRANADSALANRTTTLESTVFNGPNQNSNLASRISTEETTRASQTAALASRATSLEASVVRGDTSLNPNPSFALWPDGQTYPTTWNGWTGDIVVSRDSDPFGRGGWCMVQSSTSLNAGLIQGSVYMNPGYYVIEAEVHLLSGSLQSAGITCHGWGALSLNFMSDPDVNGVVGHSGYGVRRFTKLVHNPHEGYMNFHQMNNWEGFGPAVAKTIRWMRVSVRTATDGEIKAQKVIDANLIARVQTNEGVLATHDGKLAAYLTQSVVAGTSRARFELRANQSFSEAELAADAVYLGPNRALEITESGSRFNGNLNIGAKISVGSGAGWQIALKPATFTAKDGDVINFGYDFGYIPSYLPISSNGLATLNAGESYNLYLDPVSSTQATARLKILVPGTASSVSLTTDYAGSSGPTRQIDKSQADSANGTYRFKGTATASKYIFVSGGGGGNPYEPEPIVDNENNYIEVTMRLWAYVSGVWQEVKQMWDTKYVNAYSSGTYSKSFSFDTDITVSSGVTKFGLSISTNGSSSTCKITEVSWSAAGTPSSVRSATPNGQTAQITIVP